MYTLTQDGNGATFGRDGSVGWTLLEASEYLAWLAEGNTPEPYVTPPTPIPTSLSMKQARLALYHAGHLEKVELSIAQMDKPSKIIWEFSNTVERSDPLVSSLSSVLGLSESDLDDLFKLGSTL